MKMILRSECTDGVMVVNLKVSGPTTGLLFATESHVVKTCGFLTTGKYGKYGTTFSPV